MWSAADWKRYLMLATWGFFILGVLVRVARYLLCFPLWGDELMLAENLIDRPHLVDLFAPLKWGQVCPLGFLALEWLAVQMLGFSELSLRLFPMLLSLLGLGLFFGLARRLLHPAACLIAVAALAVSYHAIRHSSEVKPYSADLTAAIALMYLAARAWQAPEQCRWLWMLAVVTPAAVVLSYPAVFVAGGVSLALVLPVWRGSWRGRAAFTALQLTLGGSFLFILTTVAKGQYETTFGTVMEQYWTDGFLPWREPLQLPLWLLKSLTGETFAWPIGGSNFGSVLTTLLFVVGLVAWWRGRKWLPLCVCLGTLGLSLAASAMQRYPFGNSIRLAQYLGPMILLPMATGAALVVAWLARRSPNSTGWFRQRRAIWGAACLLAGLGLSIFIRDIARPYKTRADEDRRAFARWFWTEYAQGMPIVCASSDLGLELPLPPSYLCFKYQYSPHHGAGKPALQLEQLAAGQQVRVVWPVAANVADSQPSRWKQLPSQLPPGFRLVSMDRLLSTPNDKYEPTSYEVFTLERVEDASTVDGATGHNKSGEPTLR